MSLRTRGAFAIDSNSGELTVANGDAFSFANNPIITGIVKVANGAVSENATITISHLHFKFSFALFLKD